MRRISRMLLLFQVLCIAACGGAAAAAEIAGEPGEDAAAAEWSVSDAELALLTYWIAAQRTDAWTAYADAIARMHADAAVLARFGLAPPEEAMRLNEQRAAAFMERDAAKAAKETARAELAERLLSAASKTLKERTAAGQPASGEGELVEGAAYESGTDAGSEAGDGEGGAVAGESGDHAAASADAVENGAAAGGAPVSAVDVPYPDTLLQDERAMRQACRQIEAAGLLVKAGVGSAASLAEAHFGCLQAELAWIEAQAEEIAALLTGASESGVGAVAWSALLGMVRERQPALYDRWIRHLKADAACPADQPTSAVVPVTAAGGTEPERLTGCAIGLPGIRIANPQQALRTDTGVVYLPLRPYAAAFGASLEWNASAKIIALTAGETRLTVAPGSAAIGWNGGAFEMAHAALSVNGQCFVPASFFQELFGLNLYWDENLRAGWMLPESV